MKGMYKRASASFAVLATLGVALVAGQSPAAAQSVVPQSAPNPIVINQVATTDNIVALQAGGAERLDSTYLDASGGLPKYLWVYGMDQLNEYLSWTVSTRSAARYQVSALIAAGAAGQSFDILVDGVVGSTFSPADDRFNKVPAGTISLPAGKHVITLRRRTLGGGATIKSIELLRESDVPAWNDRLAAFKVNTSRFNDKDYGLMFQYGAWGYPRTGDRKSIDQQAADFNVPSFVDMVKSTGAKYVIWSITWYTYMMNAPITEVDAIVGNGNRTSSRDLVGDIAKALKAQNIDFYLYYHTGQDSGEVGYNTTDWWRAQKWPDGFTQSGYGDRSTFFRNWTTVVSAIGRRYGTLLDGWFFDDGLVYYPAAFEAMGKATRDGNPNRLVSYNAWEAPRYTDFQDVSFGEVCHSDDADVGGDGLYKRGPEKGIHGHCMNRMEYEWGIRSPNMPMGNTLFSVDSAYSMVQNRAARKVPTSFNMMMYEDGTVLQASLDVLRGLKTRLESPDSCAFACTRLNNTDAAITYTGGWRNSSNRGAGDYMDDVQATSTNGDSATVTFNGTGIRLYMPKSTDYGDVEVFVDDVSQGVVSAYAARYAARQQVFEKSGLTPGQHRLRIVKRGAQWMQIDYVEIDNGSTRINDNDAAITKTGNWRYSANRSAPDYRNDVSYITDNGGSFSYTFTGTGVQMLMPKSNEQGQVEVFIDGASQGVVDTRSDSYLAQQVIFVRKGLTLGQHTLSARKVSGIYMQLDAIDTLP